MRIRPYLILFVLGLAVTGLVAFFQHSPGYMDADYYYAGGLRLAQGHGFSEIILWNYLDDPSGLPHPSHSYWMPLASLVAALGLKVGGFTFTTGRLGFWLLAACIPAVTASLAGKVTGRSETAWLAGLLALFPVFYLPYLTTSDSFGLYMLLGSVFLRVAIEVTDPMPRHVWLWSALLGVLAGLLHLTRADGVLWLILGIGIAMSAAVNIFRGEKLAKEPYYIPGFKRIGWLIAQSVFTVILGYLVIMGPWLLRNLIAFGSPLSPGGTRTLWFTQYDELFIYPASQLTMAHWLKAGLVNLIETRIWALGQNLQTAVAVQGEIFLVPLILAGFWRLRRLPVVRWAGLAWLLTLVGMTLIFPFAGARGGFFHSGAALQPWIWVLAAAGLEGFIAWGVQTRGWQWRPARPVFSLGMLVLAVGISYMVVRNRVIGADSQQPVWDVSQVRYETIEATLQMTGIERDELVMVNNAPGYFVANGRPAITIPFGDLSTLLAVAQRYKANYLWLEIDQIQDEDLFAHPGDRPGLLYLGSTGGARLFKIEGDYSLQEPVHAP